MDTRDPTPASAKPARHGLAWDDEEDARALLIWERTKDPGTVARELGRSTSSIIHRLERLLVHPVRINRSISATSATDDADDARPDNRDEAALPDTIGDGPVVGTPAQGTAPHEPDRDSLLLATIDALSARLAEFREAISGAGVVADRRTAASAVARSSADLERLLLGLAETEPPDDPGRFDPLPDRLQAALIEMVRICVADPKDRYVAVRMLGLADDGAPPTLAAVGDEFGVARERIRQRRNRAFRMLAVRLPRQIQVMARLRKLFAELSPGADWKDPSQAAKALAQTVTDRPAALAILTASACRAAGVETPIAALRKDSTLAVSAVVRLPEVNGRWRFDRWRDAFGHTVFAGERARFDEPPPALLGLKRSPVWHDETDALFFDSKKLGRPVVCESGMEWRLFKWLDRSQEVVWFQEQPALFSYEFEGSRRRYFPDAAVLDRGGALVIVEVKPLHYTYRVESLAKAAAALRTCAAQGMGYLFVDVTGKSLAEAALTPFDMSVAEEVEKSMERNGSLRFGAVRDILSKRTGKIEGAEFVSMVVNRDWAVTRASPVTISRLPDGLSFKPFLPH